MGEYDLYDVEGLHKELYDIFMEQDYENEYFDVIFNVDGEELYAHSEILAAASPVFKKLFINNRSKGIGPIQIDNYTYDEFFEFLRLIYYDFLCLLYFGHYTNDVQINEKVLIIFEIANVYKADRIITICYDSRFEFGENYTIQENFDALELAHELSWKDEKGWINNELNYDFDIYIGYAGFVNLNHSAIKAFIHYAGECCYDILKEEKLCKAIYKWGEHQAMVNDEMPMEEKNELILYYTKDIFPLFNIDFEKRTNTFLYKFAAPNDLITYEKAEEYKMKYITIFNHSQKLHGSFNDYGNCETFLYYCYFEKRNDGYYSDVPLMFKNQHKCYFVEKQFKIPSIPSTVDKMKGCHWYLLLDENGTLTLKNQSKIKKTDYLIAEMKSKTEFAINEKKYIRFRVSHKPF